MKPCFPVLHETLQVVRNQADVGILRNTEFIRSISQILRLYSRLLPGPWLEYAYSTGPGPLPG